MEQVLAGTQSPATLQAAPSMLQPPEIGGHPELSTQPAPLMVQVPPAARHVELSKQLALVMVQCPGCVVQIVSSAQTCPVSVQWPALLHVADDMHEVLSMLQLPGMVAQSPSTWQVCTMFVLHLPADAHAALDVQLAPSAEHVPGRSGHCEGPEHAAPVELQVPGVGHVAAVVHMLLSVLQLPVGHVVTKVQAPHSAVQVSHPGGS